LAGSRFFYLLRESKKGKERLQAGLAAEMMVHEMLLRELPPTWSIEANIQIPSCGDVDLFVTSADKNYYAIEIKSHRAEVLFDGQALRRADGRRFEKDFLNQAMKAALGLRSMRRLLFVNSLLVFTRATLSLPDRQLRKVTVLTSQELVSYLLAQENVEKIKPHKKTQL
jgi:hypothetical protein